jgi:hypothetical protein
MRYVAIRSEGGLIPYDLLDKIANDDAAGQKPGDFGLPKGRRLTDEISRVWSDAQSLWDIFSRRRESLSEKDQYGTTLTRERWILPLLSDSEMLGFDLHPQPTAAIVNNSSYAISHRAEDGDDAIPVHVEGFKIDLDRRLHTKLRTSPQAMLQDFLNNGEQVLWGIVTNGLSFRILRDSSRTAKPTYLEFDLESILEGNRFNEFSLFYRLCHRSRFPRAGEDPSECLLELYYQESIEQGLRVREKLREGVEETLKILGSAFLQHPANVVLRERITTNKLSAVQYHRQLLLLVYRLLFLMVAEERGLIVSVGDGAEQNQKIYDQWYSISRLRDRAAHIIEASPFGDLWVGLQQTFYLYEYGIDTNALGIPPLNGDLFHQTHAIPDLAGTEIYNHELLRAVRHLSLFKDGNLQQRVNYSALDVEELGSVYESLLDYQPVVEPTDNGPEFQLRTGMERKSTGSYYTRPELVHELVESALVPIMEERIEQAEKASTGKNLVEERDAKIKAILSMTVCDPACGSGHFLLAAARRLGKELARIRTGEDEPKPGEFHLAVRDVISHCIYGVDMNPLAVDLCKVALWLEGHWAGKPLSFLDHRIRCGNSLIGVLDQTVMEDGIPDEAFTAVTGDDKKVAAFFRKRNKQERTSRQRGLSFEADDHAEEYAASNRELRELAENTAADVRKKAQMYGGWRAGMQYSHDEAAADLWTAQFFLPLTRTVDPAICTTKDFLEFAVDKLKKPQQVAAAQEVAQRVRFFHWHLEFPEVFEASGFDVVLGNPPWERIKLQEKEHWVDDPYIANAPNKAERGRRIDEYRNSADGDKLVRVARFEAAKHDSEAEGKCVRNSARFKLTAVGDVNTYALFAELTRQLIGPTGRLGILVPTGIVTDDTTKDFFAAVASHAQLASVTGFENEDFIFPAVHHAFKFCALTIAGSKAKAEQADLVFWCRRFSDVNDQRRHFKLSADDFKVISPNTQTCPTFRTAADALLSLKLYRDVPVLWTEQGNHSNSWRLQFLRMIDMANDSELFLDSASEGCLPLYEAKMMHQFDHRWGTYDGATQENLNAGILPQLTESAKQNSALVVKPRYWVPEIEARKRTEGWSRKWLIGFRDITAAMVERTGIFSILPYAAVGHSISLMLPLTSAEDSEWPLVSCLLANLNSLVADFLVRTKLTYIHLSYFVLKQIPVLPPNSYVPEDLLFVVPRVFELVYTSTDLAPFANDVFRNADEDVRRAIKNKYLANGSHLSSDDDLHPFKWSDSRRAQIRGELDAYYGHLYGLTREEMRYVLDPKDLMGAEFPSETFRVLKERESKQYGEYRTQRLVLEAYDELAKSARFRDEMPRRISAIEATPTTVKAGSHS